MASFSWTGNSRLSIDSGDGLGGTSSDFTIECWSYLQNPTDSNDAVIYGVHDYGTVRRTQVGVLGTTPELYTTMDDTAFTNGGTFPASTWQHVAWVRDGSDLNVYLNGTRVVNTAWTVGSLYSNNDAPCIGGDNSSVVSYGGNYSRKGGDSWLDQFRISSVARYSGTDYDVPTEAFTSDADTNVLVQASDWSGSGTSFTATTGGNVTILSQYSIAVSLGGNDVDYPSSPSGGTSATTYFMSEKIIGTSF